MNLRALETECAATRQRCLFRVQIPPDDVGQVLDAIANVTPLRYGNYDQVAFRYRDGIQQYRPLSGSRTGASELVHAPCDEVSFDIAMNDETIAAVIDAIFASHPHEEPVIHIQEVMCTRFRYGTAIVDPDES